MNELYFPTLSEDGWVTNGEQQADYLFAHFFVADYSQTQLYLGKVSSLPWILQKYNNDIAAVVKNTQLALQEYFSRYFTNVEVEVFEKTLNSASSKAEIVIYVKFIDRTGKEIIVGKLAQIIDTKINKIIDINNNG